LKNKGYKLAAGLGKSIIRAISQFGQFGNIDNYFNDLDQKADDWLRYDELVLCFDDIDRKSDSLDLRDIFGFINSIVENQGAKVLIIANEEQLQKVEHYSSELREKVIGVTIQYKPDPNIIFEEIIKTRYFDTDIIFYTHLIENKKCILETVEVNRNNFRNLIFFLEHYKSIFYNLELAFQADKEFLLQKEEKLKSVINFTLSITAEYKLGLLNSGNFELIENVNKLIIFDIEKLIDNENNGQNQKTEPSYGEIFKTKYFSKSKFYFFRSILEYILGTKAFNISKLKQELQVYFYSKDGKIPEQDKILNQLSYFDCLKLSDTEYRKLTYKMLSYVDSGSYQLRQYTTAFHFTTRFENYMNYDQSNLMNRFKKGIRKGVPNYVYNYDLNYHMGVSNDIEYRKEILEITNYCLEINSSLKTKKDNFVLAELFQLFLKDFDSFFEKVSHQNFEFKNSPYWADFNKNKTYRRINQLHNEQIWKLGEFFRERYRQYIFEGLNPEKEFLTQIIVEIDNAKRKRKRLKNVSLDFLLKCLSESKKNFG